MTARPADGARGAEPGNEQTPINDDRSQAALGLSLAQDPFLEVPCMGGGVLVVQVAEPGEETDLFTVLLWKRHPGTSVVMPDAWLSINDDDAISLANHLVAASKPSSERTLLEIAPPRGGLLAVFPTAPPGSGRLTIAMWNHHPASTKAVPDAHVVIERRGAMSAAAQLVAYAWPHWTERLALEP